MKLRVSVSMPTSPSKSTGFAAVHAEAYHAEAEVVLCCSCRPAVKYVLISVNGTCATTVNNSAAAATTTDNQATVVADADNAADNASNL